MKVLLARITGFVSRFYIIFTIISFLMTLISQYIVTKLGTAVFGQLALTVSFVTILCMSCQFLDKVPLQFINIRGGIIKSKRPLGATSDDVKRMQIKRIKKDSLYIATLLFPIMLILNIVGIIMVLVM